MELFMTVSDGSFVPSSDCSVSISFSVILGFTLLLGVATFIWISDEEVRRQSQWRLVAGEKQNLTGKE
ncbi:hypothetical protein AMECASPLE_034460 [Ameca splendens]|uniref:Uncharacterized protein n=1 Tax=Ameca splendens TaxID=208324 RepID=A0ABV1A2H4_9TELE